MIVVTAASGAFGREVLAGLRRRLPGEHIVAPVRRPDGAGDLAAGGFDLRLGDYDRAETMCRAFEGADRVLLVSSPELDVERRVRQHRTALDAARDAGVGRVVCTSFLGADVRSDGAPAAHRLTEGALWDAGLPHTVLRHPFYTEAFGHPGLRVAAADGRTGLGAAASTRHCAAIWRWPPSPCSLAPNTSAAPTTSPETGGPSPTWPTP
ncbi:NAD(P)H-binding protein [Streptomyces sp. NPDC059582]|uniref:NAD(P)H-binding protein n=1 Tax=Streptomyces sp. NPDC059582 TaxID=3346875 RepID=UPI0036AEFB96